MLVRVENFRLLEMMEDPNPKGWVRWKIGPVLEVSVAHHLYHYGIGIKLDSMRYDGSQSWIVMSRGLNKYVNEIPVENGKSFNAKKWPPFRETPCDKTQGPVHTIIIFILDDCYADRLAEVQDRQEMQYQRTPRSKWKMLQNYWKFPKSECPRQVAQIMVQHGRPSCSSSTESVRSSLGRTIMGKAIRESSIGIQLGNSSKLGMLRNNTK